MDALTPVMLADLARVAEEAGLLRLSPVRLDHPGFAPANDALDRYLDAGREGEMGFLSRTRAVRKAPGSMLEGAQTLLVGLVPYEGAPGPVARYAQSVDYHSEMYRRFDVVAQALRGHLPEAESLICVDTKPVQERAAAVLAGLGFLGKNGMLITPGLGSFVLVGSLLTTAACEAPEAAVDLEQARWDACGQCRRCLDACPTDAFTAVGELDPRRCIAYLTIEHRGPVDEALQDQIGERVAGCDVCQDVCPYNAGRGRAEPVALSAQLPPPAGEPRDADPVTLATIRSGRYRAFVKDTALRRIPRRHMQRNALIALGNRPGPLTPAEHAAASDAVDAEDPQVRGAAQRVLRRRGPSTDKR